MIAGGVTSVGSAAQVYTVPTAFALAGSASPMNYPTLILSAAIYAHSTDGEETASSMAAFAVRLSQ